MTSQSRKVCKTQPPLFSNPTREHFNVSCYQVYEKREKKAENLGCRELLWWVSVCFICTVLFFNFRILYCFMLAVEGILDLRFDTDSSSMKNPDHINSHNKPTSVVVWKRRCWGALYVVYFVMILRSFDWVRWKKCDQVIWWWYGLIEGRGMDDWVSGVKW